MLFDLRLCPAAAGCGWRAVPARSLAHAAPEATLPLLSSVERATERHAQDASKETERLGVLSLLYRMRKDAGNQSAADALLR